jgi:hypothetical protein
MFLVILSKENESMNIKEKTESMNKHSENKSMTEN